VLLALGRWGTRAPFPPTDAELGVDAIVIALRTVFEPAAADGLDASYELRLGDQAFRLSVADRQLRLERGPAEQPDVRVETDPGTLRQLLWHDEPLGDALDSGRITIDGDTQLVGRMLELFRASGPDSRSVSPVQS
jgi:alkyl sulfatase BDS1-like metallo-beta-lactamase superfamily hydrolase